MSEVKRRKSAEPAVFESCAEAVRGKLSGDGRHFYRYIRADDGVVPQDYWCLASTELQAARAIAGHMGITAVRQDQKQLMEALADEVVGFAKQCMEPSNE